MIKHRFVKTATDTPKAVRWECECGYWMLTSPEVVDIATLNRSEYGGGCIQFLRDGIARRIQEIAFGEKGLRFEEFQALVRFVNGLDR